MLFDDRALAAVVGAEPVVVGGDGFEPGGGGEQSSQSPVLRGVR